MRTSVSSSSSGPSYLLRLNLSTTSNNGKSLLHKVRVINGRNVGEFVDEDGGVEEGEVVRWIGGLLVEAGLVGAEEEGAKEE
jgi:signal peptidase complex subunit 2